MKQNTNSLELQTALTEVIGKRQTDRKARHCKLQLDEMINMNSHQC